MATFVESKFSKDMVKYHCPRYEEFPDIGLYMEQVIEILHSNLNPFATSQDEKLITSTMVNNYVKQKLLHHLKTKIFKKSNNFLYVVGVLKQVFSISNIDTLVKLALKIYPLEVAYNFFCVEFEKALHAAFVSRDFSAPSSASIDTDFSELFRSELLAISNKIYVNKYMQYINSVNV